MSTTFALPVLVVEDEAPLRSALQALLQQEGIPTLAAACAAEAQAQLAEREAGLILLDLGLPDMDGLELLSQLKASEETPVIVLTGRSDIATVVEAMKRGAENFLVKPTEASHVVSTVRKELARYVAQKQLRNQLAREKAKGMRLPVGQSRAMQQVRQLAQRVAETDASVVLVGESGTGKGMIARLIHSQSRRREAPFLDVNCAALAPQLLESELFGHERGAFTDARERKLGLLEAAHGGTVFLDEVADMDLHVQSKLLKAIEDRRFRRLGGVREIQVDVRLIAATQRDLREEVAAGRFRQDLYYRLNVFQIHLPPLRERKEDILPIAEAFIAELNPVLGRKVQRIHPEAARTLETYPWPGNIRELHNVIERAMILTRSEELRPEHLPREIRGHRGPDAGLASLEEVEAAHIRRVLHAVGGNLKIAAEVLGISRSTLYQKIQRYRLTPPRSES
ncbi:MAG: sigma-54 dependent transcriptional regulator [Thermoanaerobaculum sp.]|nr:sigma-54 dependent transcriptional regulator [Thermoanaerobaculum sp.]MCX7895438.1 sigma-54 dependent transcriptional regulator [Thermoanaerobaculum sp.]MDW7967095.1 sigma-54 dependent transcriptional regulator [Thermoanaerobaculum sp.]